MPIRRTTRFLRNAVIAAAAICGVGAPVSFGQTPADQLPPELQAAGITERLDQSAPLDVVFKDENGKDVTLRDYLKPGRPVILTPVYYNCPMLCNVTLNGLVDGLNGIDWSAGKEFEIVSFSFNPKEGPELAHVKKEAYLTQYKKPAAAEGWHFLTGSKQDIETFCRGIGFGYQHDPKTGEYAHSATILFLTPDGKIARYLNNTIFLPRDLKLALVESSQGSIGSAMDRLLLFFCYHYDPKANSYAASAVKIMRLGGAVTAIVLTVGLCLLWMRGSQPRAVAGGPELISPADPKAQECGHSPVGSG